MLKKGDIIKIIKAEKICVNIDIDSFKNLCITDSIRNFEEYIDKIEWNKTPNDNTYCRIIDIVDDLGVLQTFMTKQVYVVKLYEITPVLKQKSKFSTGIEITAEYIPLSEKGYYDLTNLISSPNYTRRHHNRKPIKVGDIVTVRDNGFSYTTYGGWVNKYCYDKHSYWRRACLPEDSRDVLYKVIAMHPHECLIDNVYQKDKIFISETVLCAIEKINTREIFIIGFNGLHKEAESIIDKNIPYLEYENIEISEKVMSFNEILPRLNLGRKISRFTSNWASKYLQVSNNDIFLYDNGESEIYKLSYKDVNANDWYVLD